MGLSVQVDVLVPTGTGVLDLGHYVARRRMSSQEPSARPFLTQNLSLDQLQSEEAQKLQICTSDVLPFILASRLVYPIEHSFPVVQQPRSRAINAIRTRSTGSLIWCGKGLSIQVLRM